MNSLLSQQQTTIVRLAAHGLTNKEIANHLNIGVRAVETQFVRMRKKLGSANKTETIAEAMKNFNKQSDAITKATAEIARWMTPYMIAFDQQHRIVYMNEACQAMFNFKTHDQEVGRAVWKAITPGMAGRERLKPLSADAAKDYKGQLAEFTDVNGRRRTLVWSSGAHDHRAEPFEWWAVGWDAVTADRAVVLNGSI